MLTKEQIAKLQEPLAADAVRQREAGKGQTLDYVDGFYVFDRMNEIFGPGAWGYTMPHGPPTKVAQWESTKDGKTRTHVAYTATVELYVRGTSGDDDTKPDGLRWFDSTPVTDVGFGSGIDVDPGAAHEKAIKEAVTDAVKRCARTLGRSMGLALYDKNKEHVEGPEANLIELYQAVRTAQELEAAHITARTTWESLSPEAQIRVRQAKTEAIKRVTNPERQAA